MKPPAELAKDALAYRNADFLFNGSMEGGFDRAYRGRTPTSSRPTADAGALTKTPFPRFAQPLIVKAHEDRARPGEGRRQHRPQLNLGVSGIMFVETSKAPTK